MRFLYYFNPALLFLLSLIFFSSHNHRPIDIGTITDLAALFVLILLAIALAIYACLRNLRDTFKVTTYIILLWSLYPLMLGIPAGLLITNLDLKNTISAAPIGFASFAILAIIFMRYHHKLPFNHRFQKTLFIPILIMSSLYIPHIAALSLYSPNPYTHNNRLHNDYAYNNYNNNPFVTALQQHGVHVTGTFDIEEYPHDLHDMLQGLTTGSQQYHNDF